MEKFQLISTKNKNAPFWLQTYAGSTSFYKKNNLGEYYILITGRDCDNRSVIGRVTWNINQPDKIYNIEQDPVLRLGPVGSFYDRGTSYPFIKEVNGEILMYFTGWSLGRTVPFYNEIGMAVLNKNTNIFEVLSHAPTLKKAKKEYLGFGSMYVGYDQKKYFMIYTNFKKWTHINEQYQHEYGLFIRTSKDGIQWGDQGLELEITTDLNCDSICKPYITNKKIYFCARNTDTDYSIYYGDIVDLKIINIQKFEEKIFCDTWDKTGQAYPTILDQGDRNYLFYSGNKFGSSGMGVIVF